VSGHRTEKSTAKPSSVVCSPWASAAPRHSLETGIVSVVEHLVVDAKVLSLDLDDVLAAVESHWTKLRKEKP